MKIIYKLSLLVLCSLIYNNGLSQDLEPRAINNLPIGTNFIIGGYGYAKGNILLDPGLHIDDLNSNLHSGFAAYIRSINFFGLSAKVDAIMPYVIGDWDGNVEGLDSNRSQNGLGDIRVRFSFNFLGSQAMNVEDFQNYNPEKVSGLSLQIIAPTGAYDSDRLINIGSNRWAFKTQWGFARNYNKWVIESYLGVWFFTNNSNFFDGNKLSQEPLYTIKAHVIRKLPKKMWLSLNLGYGIGGKTKVNDLPRDSEISTMRLGLLYALPLAKQHTIRFAYITGIRFNKGGDFDAFSLSYQYRWNNQLKKKQSNKN